MTCFLLLMKHSCASHVHHMYITCTCTCTVHHMYYTCTSHVLHMYITCTSHASMGRSLTWNYFVGYCGSTHPSRPMISSTTSALRYGPLKFGLLSNSQQVVILASLDCACDKTDVITSPPPK